MYADKRYRIKAEERDRERERERLNNVCLLNAWFLYFVRNKKGEFFLVLLLAVHSASATCRDKKQEDVFFERVCSRY